MHWITKVFQSDSGNARVKLVDNPTNGMKSCVGCAFRRKCPMHGQAVADWKYLPKRLREAGVSCGPFKVFDAVED